MPDDFNFKKISSLPSPAKSWEFLFRIMDTDGIFPSFGSLKVSDFVEVHIQQVSTNLLDVEIEEFKVALNNAPFVVDSTSNKITLSFIENQNRDVFRFFLFWRSLMLNEENDSFTFPDTQIVTNNIRGTVNPPSVYQFTGELLFLTTQVDGDTPENIFRLELSKMVPESVSEIDFSYEDDQNVDMNVEVSFNRFKIESLT